MGPKLVRSRLIHSIMLSRRLGDDHAETSLYVRTISEQARLNSRDQVQHVVPPESDDIRSRIDVSDRSLRLSTGGRIAYQCAFTCSERISSWVACNEVMELLCVSRYFFAAAWTANRRNCCSLFASGTYSSTYDTCGSGFMQASRFYSWRRVQDMDVRFAQDRVKLLLHRMEFAMG